MVANDAASRHPLHVMRKVKAAAQAQRVSTRSASRISAKNQVTLPVAALAASGLGAGDRVHVEVIGPGELVLRRDPDPVTAFAGALTGIYEPGYLEGLSDEWR
jgi:bifunctional DNA-binding transcriptional regulator/antitoxin component of YhaV-PrlF toxin-antitoxin module